MCDALEPKAQQDQRNLDYDSTQPGEIQKGSYNDTMKTRAWWLQHIAHIIRSEVGQEFARAILIHDISVRLPLLLFGDLTNISYRHLPLQFERI